MTIIAVEAVVVVALLIAYTISPRDSRAQRRFMWALNASLVALIVTSALMLIGVIQ